MRVSLEALFARPEPPDRAWIGSLPTRRLQRDVFASELVAAGLLEPTAAPRGRRDSPFRTRTKRTDCPHVAGICDRCRAARTVEALLGETVALRPLRNYYLHALEKGEVSARYLRPRDNFLWKLVNAVAEDARPLDHDRLDDLPNTALVRSFRADLMACGLLPAREDHAICAHVSAGLWKHANTCTFCTAKRSVSRILAGNAALAPLRARLVEQIDAGLYAHHVFALKKPFGIALRLFAEQDDAPDHATVDGLPFLQSFRERVRDELVMSGLLERRPPVSKAERRRLVTRMVSQRSCGHGRTAGCARCIAFRRIDAAFERYPSLEPLRDQFKSRLADGFYRPHRFRSVNNLLWELVRDIGDDDRRIDHAWFDERDNTRVHRLLRAELIACGLLATMRDHVEVGRFALWSERFVADACDIDEEDRKIIQRYWRLSLMRYARAHVNRRTDRPFLVVTDLRSMVRRPVELARRLRSDGRTLRTLLDDDVRAHLLTQPQDLRRFLVWLRRNGHATATWMPKQQYVRGAFHGLSSDARRAAVSRLLDDENTELDLRVLGLLSYFGFTFVELARLRASDVLMCGRVVVRRRPYALHDDVAPLIKKLRRERLDDCRGVRPPDWNPWLFASPLAIEEPTCVALSMRLSAIGVKARRMRNDGIRLTSSDPTVRFATQKALGRARSTTGGHVTTFSSRAGSYAASMANERLKNHQRI